MRVKINEANLVIVTALLMIAGLKVAEIHEFGNGLKFLLTFWPLSIY